MSPVLPLRIGSELRVATEPEHECLVSFDGRRPWPRGVPSSQEVLEVLAGTRHVDDELLPVHCVVAAKLPEEVRDAARATVNGLDVRLAESAASAWRALAAVELAPRAVGLDQVALLDLIGATVAARERLLAVRPFVFGPGAEFDTLDAELATALDRLVDEARFRAEPSTPRRPVTAAAPTANAARAGSARPFLQVALLLALIVAAVFQLAGRTGERRRDTWVVVGKLESGHAFLAPTTAQPSDEELRQHLRALEAQGYAATKTTNGEWSLRPARGTR